MTKLKNTAQHVKQMNWKIAKIPHNHFPIIKMLFNLKFLFLSFHFICLFLHDIWPTNFSLL